MRFRSVLLLLGLLAAALPASAAELKIVRVFTGWREASSFKRIAEYFDGKEHTGGELVLRTHPDQRAGYYFLVRVNNPGAPVDAKLVLHVVTPTASAPHTYTFAAHLADRQTVLNLGLTGADWPDPKLNAVAWLLEVLGPDGQVLAREKSYLWEKPAGR